MSNIIVTGGSKGLGAYIVSALHEQRHRVFDYSLESGGDVTRPDLDVALLMLDQQVDVLINCAGINEINWLHAVTEKEWDRIIDTNLKGIFLMTQALLPQLRQQKGTVINIVSNAAHMPMRCSAAYNASKGGALILTKQLARELAPDITVFSISPNRLAGTGMSAHIDARVIETRGWSLEEAQRYQRSALLTGEETPPVLVADFIAYLLQTKVHHKFLTGCDIPYGA